MRRIVYVSITVIFCLLHVYMPVKGSDMVCDLYPQFNSKPRLQWTGEILYGGGDVADWICVFDLSTRNRRAITVVDHVVFRSLSAAGQLAYENVQHPETYSVTSKIYVVDFMATSSRLLPLGEEDNIGQPAWSQDGKKLLFVVDFRDIRIFDFETSQITTVGEGQLPSWAADNKKFAYYTAEGDLCVQYLTVTRKICLSDSDPTLSAFDYLWSPDSKSIMIKNGTRFLRWEIETKEITEIVDGLPFGLELVGWNNEGIIYKQSIASELYMLNVDSKETKCIISCPISR